MSKETNTWEHRAKHYDFVAVYMSGVNEFKEALKKEIEEHIKYGKMGESTGSYFNELIDTVKPQS